MTNPDGPRFNPERLRVARQRRGLTKVALGRRVDLTARRIAAFENEQHVPPPETMSALAHALDFPVDYFSLGSPPEVTPEIVSFRSFSRLPAGRRDAALAAATIAIELAAWLDARFALPAVDVQAAHGVEPASAATALRSRWGLGHDPAPNMVHVLEAHGVRVFSLTDDAAELDAFSMWSDGTPFVFLTRHKSAERSRWDAAHELGHLVLHAGFPPQGRVQETEADAFAAEFLLPRRSVLADAPRLPALPDIRQQKLIWRVSAMAYIRRLHQLRAITDWHYRSLVVEASQAGYRSHEDEIPVELPQAIGKMLEFLAEDGVSLRDIGHELSVPPNDIHGLLFGLPLMAVDGGGDHHGARPRAELRLA